MVRVCPALGAILVLASFARAEPFHSYPVQPPLTVGPFSLTERSGKTVTREDLRGHWWVAHFFYCTCQKGCAETTATMARLHKALAGNDQIRLVSIHVFPENENLDFLRAYADDHQADTRWLFLTGDPATVEQVVTKSFHLSLVKKKEQTPGDMVDHSFFLFLIDPEGKILGRVNGKDPSAGEALKQKIRELIPEIEFLQEPESLVELTFQEQARAVLPSVNAGLNATCLVLLILGFIAIRRKQEQLHKICMLSALGVSLIFLTSYLFYHFAILEGQPTYFEGEGWIRPVYFTVLISHTVLAAVVAPMALATAYLGLRDRRVWHRRLARWTWPVWLYVSLTGVVVYWMLYHLYPPG